MLRNTGNSLHTNQLFFLTNYVPKSFTLKIISNYLLEAYIFIFPLSLLYINTTSLQIYAPFTSLIVNKIHHVLFKFPLTLAPFFNFFFVGTIVLFYGFGIFDSYLNNKMKNLIFLRDYQKLDCH